jgi:hypothetical protein
MLTVKGTKTAARTTADNAKHAKIRQRVNSASVGNVKFHAAMWTPQNTSPANRQTKIP